MKGSMLLYYADETECYYTTDERQYANIQMKEHFAVHHWWKTACFYHTDERQYATIQISAVSL